MSEYITMNLPVAREQLTDILNKDSEKSKSWVEIKGKRYLKVATLFVVLRDVFGHNLIVDSKVEHDCEHRVVIKSTVRTLNGMYLSSGLAERFKDPKSKNPQLSRAIECCQTASWGRAIKSLLSVGTDIATADEIDPEAITNNVMEDIV
jgi:hypothetical protein